MTFALLARLGLDANDFVKGAKKAEKAVDDVADRVDDLADDAEKSGKKAGSNLASSLIKAATAAGIGTALVGLINEGFDRIGLAAKFKNEFGLVQAEADRLSADAGDTYAAGWGESADEVRHALGLVNQKLVETGRIGQEETDKVATGALGIAEVFGEDVNSVIRSVSQLLLNGLAPDADSALDQVTAALQSGANGAGDFFDSIDEYSQHFAGFGLSATDMFAIFEHGLANGQRDTDKLADAVKEMRLRTVEDSEAINDAYRDIGLNADDTRAAIAKGGDSARDAFTLILKAIDSVEDPIEQNRLAVQLIGTQYEDLGPTALDSLLAIQGATDDTTGANKALVESMEDSRSEFEKLRRDATTFFGEVGESAAGFVNDGLAGLADAAAWLQGDDVWGARQAEKAFKAHEQAARDAYDAVTDGAQVILDVEDNAIRMGVAWDATQMIVTRFSEEQARAAGMTVEAWVEAQAAGDDYRASQVRVAESSRLAGQAQAYLEAETKAKLRADQLAAREADVHAKAVGKLRDEVDSLIVSNGNLVGAELSVEEAQIKARQARDDLAEATADATLTEDDRTLALISATEAQINAAQSAADHQVALREANGETVSARDKQLLFAAELDRVAGTLDAGSPLRTRVEGYAAQLRDIPDDIKSLPQFQDDRARASLMFYLAKMSEIPRNKSTTVTTNYVSKNLGYRELGGPVQQGRTYWVGEKGPELVTFGHDGYVHDANKSAMMARDTTISQAASQAIGVRSAPAAQTVLSNSTGGVITAGDVSVVVQIGQQELSQMMMDVIVSHEQQKELVA